jgi:hypothetical protein
MSGYIDNAFSYNEEDLGLDAETKLRFVPNKKELELFKMEKLNMYKGTWMVCFVYGLSAAILLSIIFFTDWGRTYIYNKFFPAVITYVLGAIIIIIYLLVSIFSIKPRKLKKSIETLPVCPDYWKLEKVTDTSNIMDIMSNIKNYSRGFYAPDPLIEIHSSNYPKGGENKQYILNGKDDIILSNNQHVLNYKCVPDPLIYGNIVDIKSQFELVNNDNTTYNFATTSNNYVKKDDMAKYIYVPLDSNVSKNLQNYSDITGIHKSSWTSSNITAANRYFDNTIVKHSNPYGTPYKWPDNSNEVKFNGEKPLICNEVYPYLLDSMEDKVKNQALKCEYAKKCGISWSYLDCYNNTEDSSVISVVKATTS